MKYWKDMILWYILNFIMNFINISKFVYFFYDFLLKCNISLSKNNNVIKLLDVIKFIDCKL
jgi:hypothetical protein